MNWIRTCALLLGAGSFAVRAAGRDFQVPPAHAPTNAPILSSSLLTDEQGKPVTYRGYQYSAEARAAAEQFLDRHLKP